jgi:large subunit ribosomal protein L29
MKTSELRDLGAAELIQKNNEFQEELFRLRIRHTTGQLESTASLGKVKKDIARIKTVLRDKEAR